jgi:hypothetical protein
LLTANGLPPRDRISCAKKPEPFSELRYKNIFVFSSVYSIRRISPFGAAALTFISPSFFLFWFEFFFCRKYTIIETEGAAEEKRELEKRQTVRLQRWQNKMY